MQYQFLQLGCLRLNPNKAGRPADSDSDQATDHRIPKKGYPREKADRHQRQQTGNPPDDGAGGASTFGKHSQQKHAQQRTAHQTNGLGAGFRQRAQFVHPKSQHNHQRSIGDRQLASQPELLLVPLFGVFASR